jgi:hypothetical protein
MLVLIRFDICVLQCRNMTVKDNTTLYAWYCCLWWEQSYRSVGLLPLSMWRMELLRRCTGHNNPWNWLDM